MNKTSILRYIGNFFLMLGYQIILWGNFKYGLLIKFIGGIFTIPFAIKLKLYDVLILSIFFSFSELIKIIELFLNIKIFNI